MKIRRSTDTVIRINFEGDDVPSSQNDHQDVELCMILEIYDMFAVA